MTEPESAHLSGLNDNTESVDLNRVLQLAPGWREHAEQRRWIAGFLATPSGALAVRIPSAFSTIQIDRFRKAVYAHRSDWTPGFGGEQFSLGEVYYHYSETLRDFTEYAEAASRSMARLNAALPELYPRLLDILSGLFDAPVAIRPGWAGPGIVIFPAGGEAARSGGEVHFDWDGLPEAFLTDPSAPCFSFVCMLSKPERGGELRIWRHGFRLQDYPTAASRDVVQEPTAEVATIDYRIGELVCFRSLWAHRILPFSGGTDRICLTCHALKHAGGWWIWM